MSTITPDYIGPASPGQRLLWAFERRLGSVGALNIPLITRLNKPITSEDLQNAIKILVARHDSLRTRLVWKAPRLMRITSPINIPEVKAVDLSRKDDPIEAAKDLLGKDLSQNTTSADWLLNSLLLKIAPNDFIICINIHHTAVDAVSIVILRNELEFLLQEDMSANKNTLPKVEWSYTKWIDWQIDNAKKSFKKDASYWENKLEGATGPQLPTIDQNSSGLRRSQFSHTLLREDVYSALSELAREERTTIFSVMLSIFYLALSRVSKQTDITITTLLSDRLRPEVFRTVGYFVSSTALRVNFKLDESFAELLKRCRNTMFEAIQHQGVPFHMLPRRNNENSQARIDDVVIQIIDEPMQSQGSEALLDSSGFGRGRTFDLELVVTRLEQSASVVLLYNDHRYEKSFIDALVASFAEIATNAVANPKQSVAALIGDNKT